MLGKHLEAETYNSVALEIGLTAPITQGIE
jgi:hypothetical protein